MGNRLNPSHVWITVHNSVKPKSFSFVCKKCDTLIFLYEEELKGGYVYTLKNSTYVNFILTRDCGRCISDNDYKMKELLK